MYDMKEYVQKKNREMLIKSGWVETQRGIFTRLKEDEESLKFVPPTEENKVLIEHIKKLRKKIDKFLRG